MTDNLLPGDRALVEDAERRSPMDYSCNCDNLTDNDGLSIDPPKSWANKYGFCCPHKYRGTMAKYRLWSDNDPHVHGEPDFGIEGMNGGQKSARTKANNKLTEAYTAWKVNN